MFFWSHSQFIGVVLGSAESICMTVLVNSGWASWANDVASLYESRAPSSGVAAAWLPVISMCAWWKGGQPSTPPPTRHYCLCSSLRSSGAMRRSTYSFIGLRQEITGRAQDSSQAHDGPLHAELLRCAEVEVARCW